MRIAYAILSFAAPFAFTFGMIMAIGLPEQQDTGKATAVEVDQLKEEPKRFFGKDVKTKGEVKRIFNKRIFTVEEEGISTSEVLVIIPRKTTAALAMDTMEVKSGMSVTVTGRVMPFILTVVEREEGLFEDREEISTEFSKQPYLRAHSVITADRGVELIAPKSEIRH